MSGGMGESAVTNVAKNVQFSNFLNFARHKLNLNQNILSNTTISNKVLVKISSIFQGYTLLNIKKIFRKFSKAIENILKHFLRDGAKVFTLDLIFLLRVEKL
jgi:hypothetical protein